MAGVLAATYFLSQKPLNEKRMGLNCHNTVIEHPELWAGTYIKAGRGGMSIGNLGVHYGEGGKAKLTYKEKTEEADMGKTNFCTVVIGNSGVIEIFRDPKQPAPGRDNPDELSIKLLDTSAAF